MQLGAEMEILSKNFSLNSILLKAMDTTVRQGLTDVSYLLDCWKFNGTICQHFGDLLKVLDRALSNYFVGILPLKMVPLCN